MKRIEAHRLRTRSGHKRQPQDGEGREPHAPWEDRENQRAWKGCQAVD